jgi:cytosine/adenosine deaminase-related metal-dependent hydrolase
VIRADDLNMCPVHDAVTSVVTQTSLANVESVMIAGQWRKRDGRMLAGDLVARKQALAASGRRIMDELRSKAH